MAKSRGWVLFAIATALVVLVAVGIGLNVQRSRLLRAELEERTRAARLQMETLERVATAEYIYRNVIYASRDRLLLGRLPAGSTEVLFSVSIRVQAGVDLSQGYSVAVSAEKADRAFVTLPEPTVFVVDADESTIEEYFSEERLMRLNWLDLGREIELQKSVAREDAVQRGLLTRARTNAISVITELFALAGFAEVDVTFAPPAELRG